jgi:hypothetical protein
MILIALLLSSCTPPFSRRLSLAICIFHCYGPHQFGLFSVHDPTEVAIQKMIDASQRILKVNSQDELGGISPPLKRHLRLELETLENASRDADELERLLKVKQKQKEEAMQIEDTQKDWLQRLKCSR